MASNYRGHGTDLRSVRRRIPLKTGLVKSYRRSGIKSEATIFRLCSIQSVSALRRDIRAGGGQKGMNCL